MKLLSGYVSRTVFSAMLLVLVLLLGLESVFSFIGELPDVKGAYTATQALIYILLTAPRRAYELLPISALVGGIAGLGMLASSSEVTVMRAAGVSIWRIVWWVLRPTLALVVVGVLMAQFVVPITEQAALTGRGVAQGNNAAAGWLKSYWHREGNTLVRVGSVAPAGELHDVTLLRFSASGGLIETSHAELAHYERGAWRLQKVQQMQIHADGTAQASQRAEQWWPSLLTPKFLRLVTLDAEYLSITNLYRYARYMQQQGLDSAAYFLQFWKKAFAPIATLSMVLIACSFVFGALRSVSMGLRILTGVMTGLLFRYGQDFLGYVSLVYDFSPIAAAGLPIALCLLVGGVAIARVK